MGVFGEALHCDGAGEAVEIGSASLTGVRGRYEGRPLRAQMTPLLKKHVFAPLVDGQCRRRKGFAMPSYSGS